MSLIVCSKNLKVKYKCIVQSILSVLILYIITVKTNMEKTAIN